MKENIRIDLEEVLFKLKMLFNDTYSAKTAAMLDDEAYFDDMRNDIQFIVEELKNGRI